MRTFLLVLAAVVVACSAIQNIDLQQPLVRLPPNGLNDEGYFGYSVVLHQKLAPANLNSFRESVDNTL